MGRSARLAAPVGAVRTQMQLCRYAQKNPHNGMRSHLEAPAQGQVGKGERTLLVHMRSRL